MDGGALSDSGEWICPKKGFLFPVRALSKVFRGKFIAGLDDLRQQGHLPDFLDPPAWQALKQDLYAHDWVVYAKQPLGGPQAVLAYLGRYTHRVAISNERIIGIANDQVAFRVRADAEGRKRTLRLPGGEFIARFLLHVLPSGFKRIRHYGLLSPARKKIGLAARSALAVPPPEPVIIESVAAFLRRVAETARRNADSTSTQGGSRRRCCRSAGQRPEDHETGFLSIAAGFSCGWPGHSRTGSSCGWVRAAPRIHQSGALLHAIRLTSNSRSLQSP